MPTHGEFNVEAKRIEEMIDAGARFLFNGHEVDNWQDLETRIVNRSESDQEQFREAIRTTYNNTSQRAGRFTWIPSNEKGRPRSTFGSARMAGSVSARIGTAT